MTPQTSRAWAKALAAVHPDAGGDAEAFIALKAQRAAWDRSRPRACRWCLGAMPKNTRAAIYCRKWCAIQALGQSRKARLRLGDGTVQRVWYPEAARVARASV